MNTFIVGDIVRDTNPNWINYGRRGTVVSVKQNEITWRSNGELITDKPNELEKLMHADNFGAGMSPPSTRSEESGLHKPMVGHTVKIMRDWLKFRYYKAIDRRRDNGMNTPPMPRSRTRDDIDRGKMSVALNNVTRRFLGRRGG